ncbi:MAG: P-loop NTPase [Candidatus Omnitrophica bacterium]|nr:P-loop NTPase [Candidatus Omnitrophota bacterium]
MKQLPEPSPEPVPEIRGAARPPLAVAIASGKGGVGKSVLSVHLGQALAEQKKDVLLVDADCTLANLDILLDVRGRCRLHTALDSGMRLNRCVAECAPRLRLLSLGTGLGALAQQADEYGMRSQLQSLEESAQVIVVDTGAGTARMVLAACLAADLPLIVTTPDPTAMADAYTLIKLLRSRRPDCLPELIVNMVRTREEGREVAEKMRGVCAKFLHFEIKPLAVICSDRATANAVRERRVLERGRHFSPVRRAAAQIAEHIRRSRGLARQSSFFAAAIALLCAEPGVSMRVRPPAECVPLHA